MRRIRMTTLASTVALWTLATAGATAGAAGTRACSASWSIQSTPNPNTGTGENQLAGVAATAGNDAWSVGLTAPASGDAQTLALHWDGSSWTRVATPNAGSPPNGQLSAVVVLSPTDAWAVGGYLASNGFPKTLTEHWNGSAWSVVPSPNAGSPANGSLSGIDAISANNIWAVGGFQSAAGPGQTLTEHWNGSAWKVVASPNSGMPLNGSLASVSTVGVGDVWAVGGFDSPAIEFRVLIEHYNGSKWVTVPGAPLSGSERLLTGVAAVSTSDVSAVGFHTPSTLVERWNGTSWSVVPSPNPGSPPNDYLAGVTAIAAGDLLAVGAQPGSGTLKTLIEHWDGSTWTADTSPSAANSENRLQAAGGTPAEAWAIGYSTPGSGGSRTLALHRCPG